MYKDQIAYTAKKKRLTKRRRILDESFVTLFEASTVVDSQCERQKSTF